MAIKKALTDASIATFHVTKAGPNGRPAVEMGVVGSGDLASASGAIIKNITRNSDLIKKLGLKACNGCISGFDIWIRHRFDEVITTRF